MTVDEFKAKRLALVVQCCDEEAAIVAKAMKNGTWKPGLDSNRALFKSLEETYRKKVAALEAQAAAEGLLTVSAEAR